MNTPPRREPTTGEPSPAQQSLWFLHRLTPGLPVHTLAWRIGLTGPLDPLALHRAFDAVAARHDALRTRFEERDHGPVRVVEDRVELPFVTEDLRGLADRERTAELRRRCEQEAAGGFDLSRAPLIRIRLLRTGPQRHHLLVAVHHIVFDGASLGLLLAELGAAHREALGEGPPSAPPARYGDFCRAQRELLDGPKGRRHAAYWKEALDGAAPLLDLPTDRMRGPVQRYRSARWTVSLGDDLTGAVRRLGRATRNTPFAVLLTAFQVLLSRQSGQGDVSVGVPVSGRTRSEFVPVIGLFANSVVLRGRIDPAEPFRALLRRTQGTLLDALDHQALPFESVLDEVRPPRTLSHTPLFQVVFGMDRAAGPTWDGELLPGVAAERPELLDNGYLPFELVVTCTETDDGIDVGFEYDPQLYDRDTVERLAGQYRTLLGSAVADPDAEVGALDLLDPEERRQVLYGWPEPPPRAPAYLLDPRGEPVPVGVAGALYRAVGGDAPHGPVAAGDLLEDRFGDPPGGWLRPTGRRCRRRADGSIEQLGRVGEPAEVRGYRVHPAQVAAVLREHPGVRECELFTRERSGEAELAACVVLEPGSGAGVADLRAHLAARLADHLLPSSYLLLDALVRDADGEPDLTASLAAGPASSTPAPAPAAAPDPPFSALERVVTTLWGQVLGLDDITADDDFFGLGGQSMSAARITGTLQELFDVRLPASLLFHDATPGRVAARIRAELGDPAAAETTAELVLELLGMSDAEADRRLGDVAASGAPAAGGEEPGDGGRHV